jgi:hypothetical protein
MQTGTRYREKPAEHEEKGGRLVMTNLQHPGAGLELLDERVTRRLILRRLGGFGLAATAGAGLAGLLGVKPAYASTPATATTGIGFPPQDPVPPPCSCETLCSLNVGRCTGGACPSGSWCYHCDGCGVDGNICLSGCDGDPTCYYCA